MLSNIQEFLLGLGAFRAVAEIIIFHILILNVVMKIRKLEN